MIELILVMTILGILGGVVLVTFPSALRRARDSKRKSEIKQYQVELEVYANSHDGLYTRRDGSGNGIKVHVKTFCFDDLGNPDGSCPEDPKEGQSVCGNGTDTCGYWYMSDVPCGGGGSSCATQYFLWTRLENPVDEDTYWVVCSDGRSKDVSDTTLTFPVPIANRGVCPF